MKKARHQTSNLTLPIRLMDATFQHLITLNKSVRAHRHIPTRLSAFFGLFLARVDAAFLFCYCEASDSARGHLDNKTKHDVI